MNKYTKSKTSLFLMELILTILLFAACSAVCVRLFVTANLISKQTQELNRAVAIAQGFAEVMRGTDGSIEQIMSYFPEAIRGGDYSFEVFYNEEFDECEYKEAAYMGSITLMPSGSVQNMDVEIVRLQDHEEVYSLAATKYMSNEIIN